MVLRAEVVRSHRVVGLGGRRGRGTGACTVEVGVAALRPCEREVVGRVGAVVEHASPVAGRVLRRPDFNRGGRGVEEARAEVERTRAVAVAGQLRLAVRKRDGGADLRRGGAALGVVEVAVEAPAVRKRDSRLRNRRAKVQVKPVDVADTATDALAIRARPHGGEAGFDLLLDLCRRRTARRGDRVEAGWKHERVDALSNCRG